VKRLLAVLTIQNGDWCLSWPCRLATKTQADRVPEAARKYGFTQGEYRKWADEFMRGGVDALKVNRRGWMPRHRKSRDSRNRSNSKTIDDVRGARVRIDPVRGE